MSEEEIYEMYGGENKIFEILLNDLKEGTFSDCDEKFQYCCYKIITSLQQELTKYKERCEKAIEKLEALIVFWKKYNPIDNYMQVEQFKGVISILEDKEKK